MIFFPWLFVAFGFGWCIGRLLLNRWWRAELDKLKRSTDGYIKANEEHNAEILKLVDECKATVHQSVGIKKEV